VIVVFYEITNPTQCENQCQSSNIMRTPYPAEVTAIPAQARPIPRITSRSAIPNQSTVQQLRTSAGLEKSLP
jgi:hypothetical protein